jgi:hypothetical protein
MRSLLLIISACYSWEITLNVGLDTLLGNMQKWRGVRKKAELLAVLKFI